MLGEHSGGGWAGHDYVVVLTASRFGLQQPALVAVHKFGNLWYASVGDVLRSEPNVLRSKATGTKGHTGPAWPRSLPGLVRKVLIQSATVRSVRKSLSAS